MEIYRMEVRNWIWDSVQERKGREGIPITLHRLDFSLFISFSFFTRLFSHLFIWLDSRILFILQVMSSK